MISKDLLLQSMIHDCEISKHLFTKISAASMDYRPTPKQRSMKELLRYLSICGIGGATCMTKNNWDLYGKFSERAAAMDVAEFPAKMDQQIAELKNLFNSLSEEDLETKEAPLPGGGSMPLGAAFLNAPAKWLTAYKMQLFLYAKAAEGSDIRTANVWGGQDPK